MAGLDFFFPPGLPLAAELVDLGAQLVAQLVDLGVDPECLGAAPADPDWQLDLAVELSLVAFLLRPFAPALSENLGRLILPHALASVPG